VGELTDKTRLKGRKAFSFQIYCGCEKFLKSGGNDRHRVASHTIGSAARPGSHAFTEPFPDPIKEPPPDERQIPDAPVREPEPAGPTHNHPLTSRGSTRTWHKSMRSEVESNSEIQTHSVLGRAVETGFDPVELAASPERTEDLVVETTAESIGE
jgi:hypothetical protein